MDAHMIVDVRFSRSLLVLTMCPRRISYLVDQNKLKFMVLTLTSSASVLVVI